MVLSEEGRLRQPDSSGTNSWTGFTGEPEKMRTIPLRKVVIDVLFMVSAGGESLGFLRETKKTDGGTNISPSTP